MTKPNIFAYATSELSQDAVIAYLIAWADPQFRETNPEHFALACELLTLLVGDRATELEIGQQKVEVGVQCDHIDIWAYIGKKAVLIIEDKTNTFEGDGQIKGYRAVAAKWLDEPDGSEWGPERVISTYLKTGNECMSRKPDAENINNVDRRDILKVLNKHLSVGDDIINQFRVHLQLWEDETNSYLTNPPYGKLGWSCRGLEGFYLALEEMLTVDGIKVKEWGPVSNQTGGFLAFCWNWHWISNLDCMLYLQIEGGIRLQIRVSDALDSDNKPIEAGSELRWTLLGRLKSIAESEKYSFLEIKKSGTYKPGLTGGVADVENFMALDSEERVDLPGTVANLKLVMELLEEAANEA